MIKQYREFAVLEAVPLTGRMHQIRVHLAAAGMPIVADHHYGHTQALFLSQFKRAYRPSHREPQRPLIDRLALHAKRIAFRHPATDRETTLEADLPKDLRRTIAQLDRFG